MNICYEVERLINYAVNKGLITNEDITISRNKLLNILNINQPYIFSKDEIILDNLEFPTGIIENILDYCFEEKIIAENTITYRDLMDAKIMEVFMPSSKEVNNTFKDLYNKSKIEATDYFYNLSRYSNYIQTSRINKNLYWTTKTEFGDLEITINLSKPEKDPKDIAAAKLLPQTNYPLCLLCKENEGYAGNLNHPARQNLRLVQLNLDNNNWYMQYSPYVYYNEHCIVLHENHVPMITTRETFARLLDFVEYLPHYFIGSNADIPIVGGSILTHDHYQGGHHTFPMAVAESFADYIHSNYNDININLVKWPLSVIRISGKDKSNLISLAMFIMDSWKSYSDSDADIIAFTNDTPHNAVTPIARINNNGLFELDIVLRNNRTSDEHPMGIFHPHKELHHIKKENIGLIEVMGLAVLPGRLAEQLDRISNYLTGDLTNPSNDKELNIFIDWINELINKYGTKNTTEDSKEILQNEVGIIFSKVLQNAGVFKYNDMGRKYFNDFMISCGFQKSS